MNFQNVFREAAQALCLISLVASGEASAATVQQCGTELQQLDNALPEGMTDIWAGIIQDQLQAINALDDRDALNLAAEQVYDEYNAYLDDPDPDGDGFALSGDVMAAQTDLFGCLYNARVEEIGNGDTVDEEELADEWRTRRPFVQPEPDRRSLAMVCRLRLSRKRLA